MSSEGLPLMAHALGWLELWRTLEKTLHRGDERFRVAVADGRVLGEAEDLRLPGLMPLLLRRRYLGSGGARVPGLLGPGWTLPWDSSLVLDLDGAVFTSAAGVPILFDDVKGVLQKEGGRLEHFAACAVLERREDSWHLTRWFPTQYLPGQSLRCGDWCTGSPLETLVFRPCGDTRQLRLSEVQDHAGRVLKLVRDRLGGLLELKQGGEDRVLRLELDGQGRLSSWRVMGAQGARMRGPRYTYDSSGRLSAVVQPGGLERSFEYDEGGLLTLVQQGDSARWRFEYDVQGRVVRLGSVATDRVIQLEHLGATPAGGVTRLLTPEGEVRIQCAQSGLPLVQTSRSGGRASWQYDACNRLIEHQNEAGHITRYEWDIRGDLTRMVHPDGTWIRWAFDARHLLRSRQRSGEEGAQWVRSVEGDVRQARLPIWGELSWTRGEVPGRLTLGGSSGWKITLTWEGASSRWSRVDARGHAGLTMDSMGAPLVLEREGVRQLQVHWDEGGRWRATERVGGATEHVERDSAGKVVAWRTRPERRWQLQWSSGDRLVGVVDPLRSRVGLRSEPDESKHVLELPTGAHVRLEHGAHSVFQVETLEGEKVSGTLDSNGALGEIRWPGGSARLRWGPPGACGQGPLTRAQLPGGRSWVFSHDEQGRVVAATSPELSWTGAWSMADLVHEAWSTQPGRLEVRRVIEDSHRTIRLSLGREPALELKETLDRAGRPIRLTDGDTLVQTLEWDALGRLVSRTAGRMREQLAYPDAQTIEQRVTILSRPFEGESEPERVLERTLRWNESGALRMVQDLGMGTEERVYDAAGRLISRAIQPPGEERLLHQYLYDPMGRLLQWEHGPVHWGKGHRLERLGGVRLEWSVLGLPEILAVGSQSCRLRWDALGRLAGIEGDSGDDVRRTYDVFGRLVSAESRKGKTLLAWSGRRLVMRKSPTFRERYWGLGGRPLLIDLSGTWAFVASGPAELPPVCYSLEGQLQGSAPVGEAPEANLEAILDAAGEVWGALQGGLALSWSASLGGLDRDPHGSGRSMVVLRLWQFLQSLPRAGTRIGALLVPHSCVGEGTRWLSPPLESLRPALPALRLFDPMLAQEGVMPCQL